MKKARLYVRINGKVQGVLYRASTCDVANDIGLKGWVRNGEDGESVEILAEGEKEKLEKLLEWCSKGPKGARVEQIKYDWYEFRNEFNNFIIRHQ